MSATPIASVSFHEAELRSERLRLLAVIGFLTIFVCVTAIRVFVVRTVAGTNTWIWSILLAAGAIAYEAWMLRKVTLASKAKHALPAQFWFVSTIVETSIPAFVLAFLTSNQFEIAYRPLANPALLVFFIFIILSTLRLDPWISILSGVVASITYVCAAIYLGWRLPLPGAPAPATQTSVTLNIITLFIAGLVAAAVAREIRKHLQAALREVETKRKLDAIQHDLQVARSIQQSLLPKEQPRINGFDIAGWNQPADDTGGDYFDWSELPGGKIVVSLADVTGHGIGPALLAAVCHAYARSSFGTSDDLAGALKHINQSLASDLTSGRFVTFVAAVCCPGCPDIEILSAGHGPLFTYSRRENRFTRTNAHGLPFGILPTFTSEPATRLKLERGDLVLLATDGFFEWENSAGQDFGLERMENVVRKSRDLNSAEIITQLYGAVKEFSSGNKQQDDLTAVVIKCL